MLASVRMSACRPAPPDGSDAANVRTMGGNSGSVSADMERRPVAAGAAARESVARDAGGLLEFAILPQRPFSPMKKYMCLICGYVYDEAAGAPDEGIAPGTKWEDVPPNWTCPECGARKEDFELIEF